MAASGEENIVELLVHAGADVNAKTQLSDSMIGSDVFLGAGKTDPIQLTEDQLCVSTQVIQTESDAYVAEELSVPKGPTGVNLMNQTTAELEKKIHSSGGETPCPVAAESVNISSMKYIDQISTGASVNASVLHKSIEKRNIEKIRYLVQAGANVNLPNKYGVMPIVNILDFASLELMQLFIEHGANVNSCDSLNNSVLSLALSKQRTDVANLLVENGADVNVLFNGDRPVLNMAVELGYFDLAERMLKLGADMTRTDLNRNTALHSAFSVERYKKSSETNLPTFNEDYPDYFGNNEQYNYSRGYRSSITQPRGKIEHKTGYRGHDQSSSVDYLVERRYETQSHLPQARDKTHSKTFRGQFTSPLKEPTDKRHDDSCAVTGGQVEFTEILCDVGVNINQVNKRLESPLHLAVNHKDHLKFSLHNNTRSCEIQQLLKLGSKTDFRDAHGKTALHYCVEYMDFESVKVLLEAGADANLQDANLQTPLHVAVRLHRDVSRGNRSFNGDIKEINKKLTHICLSLITSTALLNVSDKKGNTALHYAIQSNTIEIVQRLLDAGADVTPRNNKGKTVLHKAAKTMFVDFMAIVLKRKEVAHVIDIKANKREMNTSVMRMKGSNVSDFQASYRICSSADAPTALMIAVKDQNTEVALMLLEHKADVNIRNDEGYTALHIAAEGSYTKQSNI